MKVKLLVVAILLVVGAGAIVFALGGMKASAASTADLLTATVAIGDVTDDVAATGSVSSDATWTLAFGSAPRLGTAAGTASGTGSATDPWTVTGVDVAVGDRVRKGQTLATASNAALATSLRTAQNGLNSARIQLTLADEAYANATTTDTRRQTKMQVYAARTQVAQDERTVADLGAQLARASLTAPIDGVVTTVDVVEGGESSGDAIVIQSASYEVVASAVERDVTNLSAGQAATVTVSAIGATLGGTVTAIAPVAETSSGSSSVVSYAVTVRLSDPPATLRPGMTADVTITTASATNVLRVPVAALRGAGGGYSVLVMDSTGATHAEPVTVGLVTAAYAEIRSGLNAGDLVVTGTASQQRTTNQQGGGVAIPGGFGGGGFIRGGGGGNLK